MQPDSLTNIIRIYSKRTQLFRIILQSPFHRSSSAKIDFINSRNLCKTRFYMFFRILLN